MHTLHLKLALTVPVYPQVSRPPRSRSPRSRSPRAASPQAGRESKCSASGWPSLLARPPRLSPPPLGTMPASTGVRRLRWARARKRTCPPRVTCPQFEYGGCPWLPHQHPHAALPPSAIAHTRSLPLPRPRGGRERETRLETRAPAPNCRVIPTAQRYLDVDEDPLDSVDLEVELVVGACLLQPSPPQPSQPPLVPLARPHSSHHVRDYASLGKHGG